MQSAEHVIDPEQLQIGDPIVDSPAGPGKITGFSERGYPQVNHITVARLRRSDGVELDPYGSYEKDRKKAQARALDDLAMENVADEALSYQRIQERG